ncbi:GIY-YIG nuclease family protein [Candidatus Curtissbacteria bacterium]|nr:GIY-YIG nuclease family protein [Candidatus Curtissbacteria bacterium]
MSYFVYIVQCADGTYYVGICWNLKKRIRAHNTGKYKGSFTKGRLPVKLVYWEKFNNKSDAARRERVIKGFSRFKKEELIKSLLRTK